jgi:hypothetical protein
MERLEPSVVRELLSYDIFTGVLTWKYRSAKWFKTQRDCILWNARFAGKEAFTTTDADGYKKGAIFSITYRAHHVIWCICFGKWSDKEIDHDNGNRTDNRFVNLFETDDLGNSRNRKIPTDNVSGHIGVCFYKKLNKWQAYITDNNVRKHLGYYDLYEDAVNVRSAEQVRLGYHANHGKR